MTRACVAEFRKDAGGRLTLFALTTVETKIAADGRQYLSRDQYDVDWSKTRGSYCFHMSGSGGSDPIEVSGIYFVSGDVAIKELPCQLVDGDDNPPWRSAKTKVIRQRNRTRRLQRLPKGFDVEPGEDLLDWLGRHSSNDETVYCSTCCDRLPSEELCDHIWWCDKAMWWSTPSEPCGCVIRDPKWCSGLEPDPYNPNRQASAAPLNWVQWLAMDHGMVRQPEEFNMLLLRECHLPGEHDHE